MSSSASVGCATLVHIRTGDTKWRLPSHIRPEDVCLLNDLTNWREQTAAAEGIRPHQVIEDPTIHCILLDRPTKLVGTPSWSHEGLIKAYGIGPTKLTKYGDAILKIVENHSHQVTGLRMPGGNPQRGPARPVRKDGSHCSCSCRY